MRWFRWHRGTVSNPDFAMIAEEATKPGMAGEGDRCYGAVTVTDAIAVWAVMLECAASDDHWGICLKDAKFIAIVLRWWPDEVQSVLDCFQKYNMIKPVSEGYKIVNWDKYQYISDGDPTNAERQKRYRERKRKQNTSVTDKKRKRNALPKRPETETETETESLPKGNGADAPDLKKTLFDTGVRLLMNGSHSERAVRSFIGKCCKAHGDGPVLEALQACQRNSPVDPFGYIRGVLAKDAKKFNEEEFLRSLPE